jgi:hypothetical protein
MAMKRLAFAIMPATNLTKRPKIEIYYCAR